MSNQPETLGDRPAAGVVRARVGYLGPAGTFSEEALLASARPKTIEPVALTSIYDAVTALRNGEVSWAIVPIENSLEGSISVTLDLLAEKVGDVRIVGEALLRVSHALIGVGGVSLHEIDTVLTHPAVPGQCTRFLRGELPHAQILPASSTAEAVRAVVADGQPGRAAIGTALAADIYGGTVIREQIEDRMDNETRFVWLAGATTASGPPPLRAGTGGGWKTSVVFWGAGAERAGWLVRCLDEFARRDINLTKIESRPRRERLGSYMFFADLVGAALDPPVVAALAGVESMCEELRVLGSYDAAVEPARRSERDGGPAGQ
jgi:prephenate dehydratase